MGFEQHGLLTVKEALMETLPAGAQLFFSLNGILWPIVSISQYKNGNYKLVINYLNQNRHVRVKANELQNLNNMIFISTIDLTGIYTAIILQHTRRAATPLRTTSFARISNVPLLSGIHCD